MAHSASSFRRIFRLAALATLLPSLAAAATKVWSATPTDANWNNTSNWNGGVVPGSGDDVVFPASSTIQSTNNDIVGLSLNSITFAGNGYAIAGNSITLAAGGIVCTTGGGSQVNTVSAPIALSATAFVNPATGCQIDLSGTISGGFGLTKTGLGALRLLGPNTYTGVTTISSGLVDVGNDAGLGASDGTSGTGTVVQTNTTLAVQAAAVGNERLDINGTGTAGQGALIHLGTSSWAGPIVLNSNTTIADNGALFTLSGPISGNFDLTLIGNGPGIVLSGTSSYTGQTLLTGGIHAFVDGTLSGTTFVQVNGASSVGGAGTIASTVNTLSASAIAPGTSPGILSTGNLNLASNTNVQIELNGTTVGAQYDRLNVTGSASIGGSNLNVFLGFVPAPGNQFTILTNDGVDPIVGTFAGLAEGASLTALGTQFTVSYVGGTGNDVVLTVVSSVPTLPPAGLVVLAVLLMIVIARRMTLRLPARAR